MIDFNMINNPQLLFNFEYLKENIEETYYSDSPSRFERMIKCFYYESNYNKIKSKISHLIENLYIKLKKSCRIIVYFKSGHIEREYTLVNGLKDGLYKEYTLYQGSYLKHYLSTLSLYKNGVQYGETNKYYKNGEYDKFYIVNNMIHGEYIRYFPIKYGNNKISITCTFINGKKHGKCIWYNEYGNIMATRNYENGILQGECIEYYENGNIKIKKYYKDGLIDGTYTSYYENSNIKEICNLKTIRIKTINEEDLLRYPVEFLNIIHTKIEIDGIIKQYWPNNILKIQANYNDCKLVGVFQSYYDSGELYIKSENSTEKKYFTKFDKQGNIILNNEF